MKINAKCIFAAIFCLIVVLGAVFLRFYELGSQPYWMDEGYTVNAVVSGMQNGTKGFFEILDSGNTYFCPLYCAPTKLLVRAFMQGGTSFADVGATPYRLLSAIAGLLVVGLFALIAKKTFKNNVVVVLAAIFTAFSYWQIAWSRQARWYTEYELFFWLAMFFTYLSTVSGGIGMTKTLRAICYLPLAIIFAALATLTHSLGYGLFALIAAYLAIYVIASRAKARRGDLVERLPHRLLRSLLTMTPWIAVLIGITLIIFATEAATGFNFSHALLARVSFHYELPYYLNFILRNYWFLVILSIYGFFAAPKEEKKIYWLVFLPILGYLAALSFLTDIVHYRYMFAPIGGLIITGAAGVVSVIASAAKQSRPFFIRAICYVLLATCFFLSGEGIFMPKTFYALESDSAKNPNRPYWGYTPQPDFNKAYDYIKTNLKPNDIIIASHPHFNKIFLNQPGYWIKYDYLGLDKIADTVKQGKEHYVGAVVVNNLDELKKLMASRHGFITYDFMAQDGRITPDILAYIQANSTPIFFDSVNDYSKIWVYRF